MVMLPNLPINFAIPYRVDCDRACTHRRDFVRSERNCVGHVKHVARAFDKISTSGPDMRTMAICLSFLPAKNLGGFNPEQPSQSPSWRHLTG